MQESFLVQTCIKMPVCCLFGRNYNKNAQLNKNTPLLLKVSWTLSTEQPCLDYSEKVPTLYIVVGIFEHVGFFAFMGNELYLSTMFFELSSLFFFVNLSVKTSIDSSSEKNFFTSTVDSWGTYQFCLIVSSLNRAVGICTVIISQLVHNGSWRSHVNTFVLLFNLSVHVPDETEGHC